MKVNIEIEELLKSQHQNEVVGDRLTHVNEKLAKLVIKEKAYHQRSLEELEDVKQLEELGLKFLLNKVLGNLDKALEKERKEYLAAVLKHRSIEEEIIVLKYEKEILKKKYKSPSKINEELNALIKKKEFLLKAHDTNYTREIFKRESEIGRYKLLNQKSNNVLQKAGSAMKLVVEMKSGLLLVKDWRSSGKGKYASVVKKKYISRSKKKAVQAKVELEEFGDMVQELFDEAQFDFALDSFDDFLDIFYDNLINDFVTRNKLGDTVLGLEKIIGDISSTTEIINRDIKKHSKIIVEKQKSLKDYTRDYENKAGT